LSEHVRDGVHRNAGSTKDRRAFHDLGVGCNHPLSLNEPPEGLFHLLAGHLDLDHQSAASL
jgi:hypothetical protein